MYLSDFGLSKVALSPADLTGTGKLSGTADYISPEQIKGEPVDGRADQYALACTAFELLVGAPPFRRDDVLAVIYAQTSEPPPPLTSQRPDLPSAAKKSSPPPGQDPGSPPPDFADARARRSAAPHAGTGQTPRRLTRRPVRLVARPAHPEDQPLPVSIASDDDDQMTGDAYLPGALAISGPLTKSGPWQPPAR